jgi:mono/diheme cytochrome c family protein
MFLRASRRSILALLIAVLTASVLRTTGAKAGDAVTKEERAQADDIFSSRCAACHGDQGRGDGPAAGSLKPRPVDFHNAKWQKSISDDTIAKAIVNGGAAVGLSSQMASNPDLEDEPGVVKALIQHIRSFGK